MSTLYCYSHITRSHLARVLDDLDILLAELVRVKLQEPLGNLRQGCELWLLVDVLLPILILKEALQRGGEEGCQRSRCIFINVHT